MPEKNIDLHGSAPDKHRFALLLIDVINDFDFPEADQLLKHVRPMATNLLRLKRRAQKAGVPVIYVNDNFGRWKSDFRRTVDHCVQHGRGRDVVKSLRPEKSDYFVLKPKHSGFFSTTLSSPLFGNANFGPHRHCWEFLCAFHSKRCLHARLQLVCAIGLHGIKHKERK
jgi:isochorismate hydrolase